MEESNPRDPANLFQSYKQIIESVEGPTDSKGVVAVMRMSLRLNRGLIRDADSNLGEAISDLRMLLSMPSPDPQEIVEACRYLVDTDNDANTAVEIVADLEKALAALGYEEDEQV